ncbi:MAG: CBS domain-containing protein [Phycisphaerae bacterium]|jgi:CBS domain-containing protein
MFIRDLRSRPPITVSPFATTDEAIELMWLNDVRHLLVVDDDGLVGLVTDGDLLESVGMLMQAERECMDAGSTEVVLVADVMDAEATCVSPDQLVTDAAHHMIYGRRTALPVVEDTRLLGIVTELDVLDLFTDPSSAGRPALCEEPVINHGSRVLRTVSRNDRVRKVCEKLNGSKSAHVLVVEDGRLVGLVSDWDVRMAIGRSEVGEWLNLPVTDIMVTGIPTLLPDETLANAARLMCEEKQVALPIVTRDRLLMSMITVTDLLRVFAADAVIHA